MTLKIVREGDLKLCRRGEMWYVRGTVFGEVIYVSTRTHDRSKALRVLREIKQAVITRRRVANRTFEEACESYLSLGGSPRYLAPLRHRLGKFRLADLRQADLDSAAMAHGTAHCAPQTLNRQIYTPFIAVWNHAVGNEWTEYRTWRRPRKPKGTRVKSGPRWAGTHPVPYDRAAQFVGAMSAAPAMTLTALFFTGMRPIELFGLEADGVDVKGRWIVLSRTKTGEPRGVPMHEFLVPLFTALVERGGVLFRTHKGEPYAEKDDGGGQMKSAIIGARRRLRAAGTPINDIAPYSGRHSVSTQLVVNGVHPHIKDQILGHAVDDMSRHYTNVPQAPLIEAINTLAVPDVWRALPWWEDPVKWSGKLHENMGHRTDLERRRGIGINPN